MTNVPSRTVLQNPFDFSNPVTDRSVLAGRASEMKECSYYLDQSREGASYSLALVGERASGKTSVLNGLRDYAEESGLISAHVRLDEGVTGDDLEFFREVFHSLMEACADKGVFGGRAGAEYTTFCRQILTHDRDTKPEAEPLAFGRVYATARAEDRGIALSRRMLLSDLNVIVEKSRSAGFPAVVLLIDEGDLLAGNHALLQTIRNLLMDSGHFSLIAAGTEKMFPAISDVFSPVPRQFVRINIGPFAAWKDTRRAIMQRLVLEGQDWAMPDIQMCSEIHSLTRGSPYEVMLVSHFAYRELSSNKQRVPMSITPAVISSVADQLAQQNPAVQKSLTELRGLDDVEAATVRVLSDLDGLAIDRFALARLDFSKPFSNPEFEAASDEVAQRIERVTDTGFVSTTGGRLRVEADSFQRALIKYVLLGRDSTAHDDSLLSDPRAQIAGNVVTALKTALRNGLAPGDSEGMIDELHRGFADLPLRLAIEDDYAVADYPVQAICRFETEMGPWSSVFVFKRDADRPEFRAMVKAVLLKQVEHLREFDVEVTEVAVSAVNPEALAQFSKNLERDDPVSIAVEEAKNDFSEGRPGFDAKVVTACEALIGTDEVGDEERREELSDAAFMALGTGNQVSYLALSDRVERLPGHGILHRVTRGLWEGAQGNYEKALERLEYSEEVLATLPDHHRENLWMYSPAALAASEPLISYDDLVGKVDLDQVLEGYRAAVTARRDDEPISDALAGVETPAPWLLGAAADAALVEERPAHAADLRKLAAKRVEAIGDFEGD